MVIINILRKKIILSLTEFSSLYKHKYITMVVFVFFTNSTLKKYELIDLESQTSQHHLLNKDLSDYISYRINKSVDIQKNILNLNSASSTTTSSNNGSPAPLTTSMSATHIQPSPAPQHQHALNYSSSFRFDSNFQQKFVQHLVQLSKQNYLFAKLTLDLIEKGNLIIKSSNFKVVLIVTN